MRIGNGSCGTRCDVTQMHGGSPRLKPWEESDAALMPGAVAGEAWGWIWIRSTSLPVPRTEVGEPPVLHGGAPRTVREAQDVLDALVLAALPGTHERRHADGGEPRVRCDSARQPEQRGVRVRARDERSPYRSGPVHTKDSTTSKTTLKAETYGDVPREFVRDLGVPGEEWDEIGEVAVLRSCVLTPYPAHDTTYEAYWGTFIDAMRGKLAAIVASE